MFSGGVKVSVGLGALKQCELRSSAIADAFGESWLLHSELAFERRCKRTCARASSPTLSGKAGSCIASVGSCEAIKMQDTVCSMLPYRKIKLSLISI